MNRVLFVLLFLTFSGCANYKKTYAPDGREAYNINCSGLYANWGYCLTKAGELCGAKGYEILNKQTDGGQSLTLLGYSSANANAISASGQSDVMATSNSVINRSMLVTCK